MILIILLLLEIATALGEQRRVLHRRFCIATSFVHCVLISLTLTARMRAVRVTVVVPCVCVSVRSFLPPCASRPRNIGTYVFTATRKKPFIIVIFAKNASFRSYGIIRLPRMPLTTPEPQIRIPMESTQRGHDITIRDFN